MGYENRKYLIINAFALTGRMDTIVLSPGCRYALPRAMCSLPRWGAFCPNSKFAEDCKYVNFL